MDRCKKCGAEMVLNPKTNKWFCKEKCWLKEADNTGSYPAPTKNEALDVLKEIRDLLQLIYDKKE